MPEGDDPQADDRALVAELDAATADRWDELDAALGRLPSTGPWGEWRGGQPDEDGVIQMPWIDYAEEIDQLCRAIVGVGAVTPKADWMNWIGPWRDSGGDVAERLRSGSVADAVRYLTATIRGERFSDGTIEAAMVDGSLVAAAGRLVRWAREERG